MSDADRRAELVKLRRQLRTLMVSADEKTAPALSRELRAVVAELETLPVSTEKVTADELRKRRTARQADAATRARAARP